MGKIFSKDQLKSLIKEYNVVDGKSAEEAVKDLMKEVLETALEAEISEELGYTKYDYKTAKETSNRRNGHSSKAVKTSLGNMELLIPRDREGQYEPEIVKKHQKDISSIEDRIISMYARGMSTRDIQSHMEEIYGMEVSRDMVSRITDKILPLVREWQNRPLEEVYAIIYLDGMVFNVRQDGNVIKKTAYSIMGFNLEGMKEILGIWIGEAESAKFWLNALNEIKNRGVKDILIASIDGLSGFENAINSVFPETEIQRCIVHQIRNSTKYVSYKDLKAFCKDMREIYTSATENAALYTLDVFEEKWGKKYQYAVKSWRSNWHNLSTFFKYPEEVRILIYTTNPIESYNRAIRKISKTKGCFSSDESLLKILYLATINVSRKWSQKHLKWSRIMSQLAIYFENRLSAYIS